MSIPVWFDVFCFFFFAEARSPFLEGDGTRRKPTTALLGVLVPTPQKRDEPPRSPVSLNNTVTQRPAGYLGTGCSLSESTRPKLAQSVCHEPQKNHHSVCGLPLKPREKAKVSLNKRHAQTHKKTPPAPGSKGFKPPAK